MRSSEEEYRLQCSEYVRKLAISVNGHKMVHCQAICQEALRDYFKDRINPKERAGHFVRRSENYSVSKNVDNFRKQQPKENIML